MNYYTLKSRIKALGTQKRIGRLLYEKTLGYTLTGVKMHKLSMIGANEFKGITLKECVYMSTLRELLNKLIK